MALYYMPKYRQNYPVLSQEDIAQLNGLNNLSEKMQKLTELLEIPATEFDVRRSACTELRELLRKYYPDCLLLMFGSSVSGFGFKNCDLDLLFLPFPEYCNFDYATTEKFPIPEPSSILTGETSRDILSKFDEFSHLKFIRTVLRREKGIVKRVNFMIPAKSPALKIHLSNSKIICDLSASNKLVVVNSELLQFYEKLDVRVKPLVMTLRLWARSLGFIKRSFFSNYAFTLLIIFFLQNTNPPVLPSVEFLVGKAGYSRLIAGWQTAFTTDVSSVPPTKNKDSVGELLIQFFQFYWNFDFLQNIISPFTGKLLSVNDIKKSEDKKGAQFELSSINIQDPFILSRNVCKREGFKIVFKLALITAYEMLQDKTDKMKFSMLFDPNEYQRIFDFHYGNYMYEGPKVCFINLDHDSVSNVCKTSENSQVWYAKACQAVLDVLQYGLLIECEVTDKIFWGCQISSVYGNNEVKQEAPASNLKNGSKASSPYDLELLLSIQCVLYCRTWIGRKNVTEVTVKCEDELEEFPSAALKTEFSISKELVRKNPTINNTSPLFYLKCECYKHTSPQIPDLVIMLKPLTHSREFFQVSAFLASYIPKTVKKILASD